MRAYTSKEELKDEIKKTYTKFIAEFDNIPEEMKDLRAEDVDRTPAENLAYKVGWTTLVLKWEQDERNGLEVKTPSDQFKWNQLGELYQWFTDTYAGLSLHELRTKLDTNIQRIYVQCTKPNPAADGRAWMDYLSISAGIRPVADNDQQYLQKK